MVTSDKIQSGKKKKINIGASKSVDELHVQFQLLQNQVRDMVEVFVKSTDGALEEMRLAGDSKSEFSKSFDTLKHKVKKSSKGLENGLEDLLEEWRKEVRADIKNPDRYESNH